MTLIEIVLLLLIAAIAGSIGQSLVGFRLGGCLVSAFVGFIGAIIGYWIARQFELPQFLVFQVGGQTFPFVWSVVGSMLFSVTIGILTRFHHRRERTARTYRELD